MKNPQSLKSKRQRIGTLALIAAPIAAVAVAWWLTRSVTTLDEPADADAGHDHSAMLASASGDMPQAVILTAEQARRIGVTFATVSAEPFATEIRTVGQVVVDETRVRTISLKVDGWVERLHVDYTGQPLRVGDPLLDLYSPIIVTAQEELLLARNLARDLIAADTTHSARAAELISSARRRLAWWDVPADDIARIESTGAAVRVVTMRSAVNGVVLEKRVEAGQRVMAGDVLYRVADLSTLWIEGDIYEQDLRGVRTGQAAKVTFDAFPGEQWSGRIAFVEPTLSLDTRTVRVRVELPNPALRIKPGMFATLQLTGTARDSVLSIPRSAVLATGERSIVFVRLPDGRLEPRHIVTGVAAAGRIEVLQGLTAGEIVVASATFLIDAESNLGTALGGMGDMPGMEITIPPPANPTAKVPR